MAGKVQTAARPERQAGRPAGTQDIREQQMPKKKKKARHFYDYSLLFCIIFLTSFGLVMIYSASSYSAQLNYKGNGAYFMERQAMIAAAGFVGMLTDSRSFLSYPRHEYFRRILCRLIGEWVEEGLFPNDREILSEIVRGVSYENARRYFHFATR